MVRNVMIESANEIPVLLACHKTLGGSLHGLGPPPTLITYLPERKPFTAKLGYSLNS